MTELKIDLPEELARKMEEHPEVNWPSIARAAIKKFVKGLESDEGPISKEELHELSERSLKSFLENEPDLYTDLDLIKRYK
ncbi:MAG: hypothetical protein JW891_16520 [Candidatus Lokiarchaeota archaeon]|nr:hypothetical protein [Candidatus Lokiarchaeota archaeon]